MKEVTPGQKRKAKKTAFILIATAVAIYFAFFVMQANR